MCPLFRSRRQPCLVLVAVTLGLTLAAGCDRSVERAPSLQPQPQVHAPHVAPGTPLAENQFQDLFAQTGAREILVQVFAESCGPCLTEALQLDDELADRLATGQLIVGLGMDPEPEGAREFARQAAGRIRFPLYWAPWFAERHGVEQTPALFRVLPDGTVTRLATSQDGTAS